MTQVQREVAAFHCPRCGGLMHRPAGGTLYWHVDNNHPRCDITNILASILEVQASQPSEPPLPAPKRSRSK